MTPTIQPAARATNIYLEKRKQYLQAMLALQDPMERILARLPEHLQKWGVANECGDTLQLSDLSHPDAMAVISALRAGRWPKKLYHMDGGKVCYEASIEGVRVLLFACDPPASCRVIEEEVVIPERRELQRILVCS